MSGGKKGGRGVPWLSSKQDIKDLIRMQEEAQRRAAETSAKYNFYDVISPFGSRRFRGTPGEDDFRQIIRMPQAEKEYLEQAREIRGELQGLGRSRMGELEDVLGRRIGGGGGRVERAEYRRGLNLLQPQMDLARERLENRLAQQGIPIGSEAYNAEMNRLEQSQGDALENLALSSVQAGRQEQSRRLQSDLARRSALMNEIGALTQGTAQAPAFQATPSIGMGAADVMGPVNSVSQAIMGQDASRQAAKAAGKGGATQLGSAALMSYGMGGGKGGGKGAGKGGSPQVGSGFSPFGMGYA